MPELKNNIAGHKRIEGVIEKVAAMQDEGIQGYMFIDDATYSILHKIGNERNKLWSWCRPRNDELASNICWTGWPKDVPLPENCIRIYLGGIALLRETRKLKNAI